MKRLLACLLAAACLLSLASCAQSPQTTRTARYVRYAAELPQPAQYPSGAEDFESSGDEAAWDSVELKTLHLSLPQFDVSSELDLTQDMRRHHGRLQRRPRRFLAALRDGGRSDAVLRDREPAVRKPVSQPK